MGLKSHVVRPACGRHGAEEGARCYELWDGLEKAH